MHFKLYEEFNLVETEYYKQVKELPPDGYLDSKDDDEWKATQKALWETGYVWKGGSEFLKASQFKDNDIKLFWYRLKASGTKQISIYSPGFVAPLKPVIFEEYFKPLEKNRGRATGKKFSL
jgi:hypothetical protein